MKTRRLTIKEDPDAPKPPATREEAAACARVIVSAQLERERLVAERDKAQQRIAESFNGDIEKHAGIIEKRMELLKTWAEGSPEEFGKARSLTLDGHQVGWRTGQPEARPRSGWTWKRVLENLLERGLVRFVRTRQDIDKESLIAARSEDDILTSAGVRVVQSERFFLRPDRDGQEGPELSL